MTFLFSDIEGSTALLGSLGSDRYGEVLAEHHRLLARSVGSSGGGIESTEGDGAFVVFSSPSAACAGALAAQMAFAAHAWPMESPLRVRMGIHTGEAERREGVLVGMAIHRAARIAAAANGGQVLVSDTTASIIGDELLAGASLMDLGAFRLKDIPDDQRLLQLRHDALPVDWRSPRASQGSRTNLSATQDDFIGREAALREVSELVRERRFVTITGSGGAGKTRLALEAARASVGAGFDGVWLVELASLEASTDIAAEIAAALGLGTGLDPLVIVIQRFSEGDQLLVLDNCEHLLDAVADTVSALLSSCGSLHVLATSREPVGESGEAVWQIPPLAVPPPDASVLEVAESDAVRLFLVRARAAGANLPETSFPDVAALCRRLDGIPLAIELAAARMNVLSPAAALRRFDDALRLLSTGRRRISRHQSMRAAIDWSHDLLSPRQQAVFRRLGVFAGSFTLDAAEQVCVSPSLDASGDLERDDVLDAVAALVDRSLVVRTDANGGPRFRLLETIRQYAGENLETANETHDSRAAHLQYYLRLTHDLRKGLLNGDPATHEEVALEEPNIEAALAWATEHAPASVERLVADVAFFWFGHGRMADLLRWVKPMLDESSLEGDPSDRMTLLFEYALALREVGAPDKEVRRLATLGLSLTERVEDPKCRAWFTSVLLLLPGEDRRELIDIALTSARESHDEPTRKWVLTVAARALGDDGRIEEGFTVLRELRTMIDRTSDPGWWSTEQVGESDLHLLAGRYADAVAAAHAAAMPAEILAEQAETIRLAALGAASLMLPDLPTAYEAFVEVFAITRRLSDYAGQGIALAGLAAVAAAQSQHEISTRVLSAAQALPRPAGMRASSRHAYELAEQINRNALAERFDAFLHEGSKLTPVEAATLIKPPI
jgi:predicted ATPase/class 3 adenylate cyclase